LYINIAFGVSPLMGSPSRSRDCIYDLVEMKHAGGVTWRYVMFGIAQADCGKILG
jgi:hypothetical protein